LRSKPRTIDNRQTRLLVIKMHEGSNAPSLSASELTDLLQRIEAADLSELMAIWNRHENTAWARSPEVYRAIAKGVLAQGEPLLACDVVARGLAIWPSDVRLRQVQGITLSRTGATERANAVLEQLRQEGERDEETLGNLGRTYKDLAMSGPASDREKFLRRAAETYGQAYQGSGGYWPGINAATMNLLVGERDYARKLAQEVRERCLKEVRDPSGDSYWEYAALGQAALICQDWAEAERWYARAAEQRKERYGDLQSSRRNARLILDYWQQDAPAIEGHLRVPPVMVFGGHMIDRPGRAAPRFPPELESVVATEIKNIVAQVKPGFGFSSAACGSDILFLEAILESGAEVSIVLPYEADQFIADSVDIIPGSNWRARFDDVIKNAARVITASRQRLEVGGISYEFCNQMLLGLGSIRARQLETEVIPLAVWDRQSGDGPGGAASFVQNWKSLGLIPVIIDLPTSVWEADASPARTFPGKATPSPTVGKRQPQTGESRQTFTSRIVSILFADAIGFSKLSEAEVPRFFEHFLGAIARLGQNFGERVLAKNTWGDGLYFIFSDLEAAGRFALELSDVVARTNWPEHGLPSALNIRIALHAGPVYEFDDPITGTHTYSGTHVSRAARIEPITPPGLVYASESFAALADAHRVKTFTCDYVGQTPLAKGYGTMPTYHVRSRR
jgi:class 3 adenylate cyclase